MHDVPVIEYYTKVVILNLYKVNIKPVKLSFLSPIS